jgi:hypothetical protein
LFGFLGDDGTDTSTPTPTPVTNSSSVLTVRPGDANESTLAADDTVVTNVSFQSERISRDEAATLVVTVRNPQSTADTHTVEVELFGQVVNSREVTVPPDGVTKVEFTHNIVAPGTYTAHVGSETDTIRVVAPDGTATPTPTPSTTSTTFPGFSVTAALLSIALALLAVRRSTHH